MTEFVASWLSAGGAAIIGVAALVLSWIVTVVRKFTDQRVRNAELKTQVTALIVSNDDLRMRLRTAERTAGLVVDQLGAKAGLLAQPTFVEPSAPARGMGAFPRLFANLGRNTVSPEPGQDTQSRVTGSGPAS